MKRIRLTHRTEYHYHQPVTFGPHRALMRPREGHDVQIVGGRVEIEPAAEVRWLRDMMEAARHWGFGARFVSGYIQLADGQHGATHAWTEVYLPGAGWHGFDPTNNKRAGAEHISVAVAREQEKAMPLSGSWEGPADAFDRMEISVRVAPV
jgi:transglutaminase-like putative cysteine protease